jgi:ABC-type glycerol-3-phosphate transport system substrate-binding protein
MQRTIFREWAAWLALLIVTGMATGCSAANTTASAPAATAVPATSAVATPWVSTAAATRILPTRPAIISAGTLTLTLWIADDIAPGLTPAGRILTNQLDAFSAANPAIRVQVVPKRTSGKGGLLDFLLTTRNVIPARLPDLVALDLSQVPLAAQAGILQPLDGVVPTDLSGDFFAFAAQAAHFRNQWVAVPFAANVDHLVYNRNVIRKPPQTWDEFTKQKGSLLLPLGGDSAFLLQYFALGASVTDASDQPALDVSATAQVLSLFKRAHDLNLVPETAMNLKTGDDVWTNFAAGQASMAQVSASRFIAERSKVPSALYAPVPTREGKVTTIATGWAFALVTNEPARQAAAARFMQWVVQGDRLAPWLRAARLLPTTRATVPLAVDPPDYAAFIREELEGAVPMPSATVDAGSAEAWRSAIVAVWKGQTTPEEAARNATGAK